MKNGERLYLALNQVDDKYLNIADSFRITPDQGKKEPKQMKKTITRKTLTGLLAAVIAISILALTALAAGWIPGIFRQLQEENPEDAVFEAAAQANTEITPEYAEIPQLDMSQFVLLEKYYDGETILLGYDLDLMLPEPAVGVEADLNQIKEKGHRLSELGYSVGDEPSWMKKPYVETERNKDLSEDARIVDWMMQGCLSEENYEKAWNLLETQGYVYLADVGIYLGDHILVNGEDTITAYNPDWINRTEYITENGKCIRIDHLPESAKNQDSVTVTLKVKSQPHYWYMDLEGNGLMTFEYAESEEVSFVLENNS